MPQEQASAGPANRPHHEIDALAEEFVRRWRDGERPSIDEYAARYPEWAADIRELFPTALMMEELKPHGGDRSPMGLPSKTATPIPERLGEYRILREIGRGGMGVVYEGRHETLGRRVAIKVLPANLFTTDKLRARFQREAQAAACLHHTNIIPVFGIGEQDGLSFYVMQLIDGRSIQETIRISKAENQTAGIPDLDSHAVARIGVQVADALAYAHSQGVLHRDVKPSNLMLDSKGVVWVADFGVAKMVESLGDTYMRSNLTVSGELLGTLKYMPPERFHGQSDARGDVYSLGITLYEMLAGHSPFPESTPQHLIELIHRGFERGSWGSSPRTSGLPGLRAQDPTIPADLETIVLKAAACDPTHRYQTAAELADDLRRFLDDRPILARRANLGQQFWRWCRRNRVVAALSATAAGLLLVTTLVSAIAYIHTAAANRETSRANDRMKTALVAEQEQRRHAEKTSAAALQAMNQIFYRFAPSRIIVTPELPIDHSASTSERPSSAAGEQNNDEAEQTINLPPQPVLSPEAVPLLEELLDFYEQVAQEGTDFPNLQGQAAEANQRIGDIRQRLGQFDQAITAYWKAVEMYSRPPEEGSDESLRIKVARTYNELGRTLAALQRVDEAREAQSQALTILAEGPKEFAARPEYRYELARTYYFLARRSMPMQPPVPGGPGGPGIRRGPRGPDDLGFGGSRRGDSEWGFGGPGRGGAGWPGPRGPGGPGGRRLGGPGGPRAGGPQGRGPRELGGPPPLDSAESAASVQAMALLKDLVKEHPTVPEYRHLLACCYRDAPPKGGPGGPPEFRPRPGSGGDQPRSSANNNQAVELLRKLVKDFPKVADYRYDLAETLARVGGPGRPLSPDLLVESQKRLEDALGISTALVTEYPTMPQYSASQAQIHDKLGFVFERLDALDKAETARRRAVVLQSDLAKKHPDVMAYQYSLSVMQSSLAGLLAVRGNWKEARPLLESSTARLESLLARDPKLGFMRMALDRGYRDLGQVLTHLGEMELASAAFQKAETFGPGRGPGPKGSRR